MSDSRKVVVTGATKGIGRQLVIQLRKLGFTVFASGRNSQELEQLREETGCYGAVYDLSSAEAPVALYEDAKKTMGQIDVLINNAAYSNLNKKITIAEETLENYEIQFAINTRAPFLLCRAAMKDMCERKNGHIVNVISSVTKTKNANFGIYTATKHALQGMTGVLQKEAQPNNVKVTAVHPGGTDTSIREADRPQYMKASSAAHMIVMCITAPEDVVVHDLLYRPMVESGI
eukprot:Awhi_evm1s12106